MLFNFESEDGLYNSINKNIYDYKKKKSLNRLDNDIKKYTFYSFDVETFGENNEFYLCGFMDYKGEYKVFFDVDETINYIRKIKHSNTFICATNLGFDFSVLFKKSKYFNSCDFLVNKGRFISVSFNATYQTLKFIDTLNFGGLSVEKMGDILGLPKLKKPKALGKIPKNDEEKQELIEYNKRDCEVTQKFMIYLQRVINDLGGELKITISSSAMNIYTRQFLPYTIVKEELVTGLKIKPKIFFAYYGGRTEAIQRGLIKDYYYLDFNSLYPSVMLEKYPNPNTAQYQYKEDRQLLNFEGISYFELEIPYSKYPVLPFRNPKLVFPYGRIKGYYTHYEIRYALEYYKTDIIKKMCDTIYYTQTDYYFKDYVELLYNKRLEAKKQNSFLEVFYKILMNSLYGRFALKEINKTSFFIADSKEKVFEKIKEAGKGSNFKIVPDDISFYSNSESFDGSSSLPIWSVYVTAYARILMHKSIIKTNPVYMDTDSLITKIPVEDSKELGHLKEECFVKEGIIIKPKVYFINDWGKVKGVRLPKKSETDYKERFEEMKKSILNHEFVFYDKFVQMKEGIIQKIEINKIIKVEKLLKLEDDKRDWKGKLFKEDELQDSEPLKVMEW